MTAEQQLWLTVLQAAVDDLKHPPGHRDNSRRWFISERTDEGSFRWICEHLDMESVNRKRITSMAKVP